MDELDQNGRDPAASDGTGWCVIPGILISERGIVWLREPPHADRHRLVRSIRSGKYAKPFVVDDGVVRRLQFDLDFQQSEMSLGEPHALTFRYTRKMMAFLLFLPNPRHVVIVGLGGGSLTKFCARQLPQARITTVEVNPDVLAFSELFDLPPQRGRMRLIHADARDYFATTAVTADVILLDGCDKRGIAKEFGSRDFYDNLRRRLRPWGVLVVNLAGPVSRQRAHHRLIAQAFSNRLIVVEVADCGNRLAFAINGAQEAPDWRALARRADELARVHGLDFHEFARLLRSAYRAQGLRSKWRDIDPVLR